MSDDQTELRETFEHFDDNNDGYIDREEFAQVMEALGADMTQAELNVGFDVIDDNHNGEIDFDEFSTWWKEDRF